ncbi:hypothetical protein, partial [Streptomyces sp. NPDC002403]
ADRRILAIPGMSLIEEKPYAGYRFFVLAMALTVGFAWLMDGLVHVSARSSPALRTGGFRRRWNSQPG